MCPGLSLAKRAGGPGLELATGLGRAVSREMSFDNITARLTSVESLIRPLSTRLNIVRYVEEAEGRKEREIEGEKHPKHGDHAKDYSSPTRDESRAREWRGSGSDSG